MIRPLASAQTRKTAVDSQRRGAVEAPRMASAGHAGILQSIHRPQVSLAVWQRTLPNAIQHPLAALNVLMPLHHQFVLAADASVEAALGQAMHQFGGTTRPAFAAWRADLHGLLQVARDLGHGGDIRVRLETKANGGCPVFHVDHVALRLICTYRGQGTHWLPDYACDRDGLGRGTNDHVRDWSAVREIATGHVAVMKGQRFPGLPGRALVHRSPPTSPEYPRLLCVIDIDLP